MSGRRFYIPISAPIRKNGKVSFTLIDLDGDGKRDLIIDSYVGGTGLFSYTGVLKRGDSAFESVNNADSNDDDNFDAGVPGALYSINDRGANQWEPLDQNQRPGLRPVV